MPAGPLRPLSLLQAKMRGRYLMHKVELLLSFFLLAPLWALLARVLQKVSGKGGGEHDAEESRLGSASPRIFVLI